jgi:hypothetical protein
MSTHYRDKPVGADITSLTLLEQMLINIGIANHKDTRIVGYDYDGENLIVEVEPVANTNHDYYRYIDFTVEMNFAKRGMTDAPAETLNC